jgi:16S rRNA (guanine(966)-N(2))-methyltransferase RsmD
VRIIRGKYKTRRFKVPKGFPSRPTTDFAKEGLFNILENQIDFHELSILDLCSGTGSITIEFLSRDAGEVTAVDQNYNCVRHLKQLGRQLECENSLTVIKADIIKFLDKASAKYDIIFADPPFDKTFHEEIVSKVFDRELLNENGILIVEHGRETKLEHITQFQFLRKYGNVIFSFFQK